MGEITFKDYGGEKIEGGALSFYTIDTFPLNLGGKAIWDNLSPEMKAVMIYEKEKNNE